MNPLGKKLISSRIPPGETRSPEQLWEQYQVEKELADRLRLASKEQRRHLYAQMYDELFRRIPHHPQLRKKGDLEIQKSKQKAQVRFLQPFLKPSFVFLEVGVGDCSVSFQIAKQVAKVYAVDVSEEITKHQNKPVNFELILSDGSSIPVPENSVDLTFSNQLMEHLHSEDAKDQLANILKALKKGGKYICITPNRINGPADISRYFDDTATGMHLREYSYKELGRLFTEVGFTNVCGYVRAKGMNLQLPIKLLSIIETLLETMPKSIRHRLADWYPFRMFLGINLIGTK